MPAVSDRSIPKEATTPILYYLCSSIGKRRPTSPEGINPSGNPDAVAGNRWMIEKELDAWIGVYVGEACAYSLEREESPPHVACQSDTAALSSVKLTCHPQESS